MTDKIFIGAQELLEDSYALAHQILDNGFEPNYIVGIWRGGTPIGIAVQELLDYHGVSSDHIAIRTSSYKGIKEQNAQIRVHGLHYVIENVNVEDKLLIIDDTFDSGRSVDAVIQTIKKLSRANTPNVIKVATVYYKPTMRVVDFEPDFYVRTTDKWVVFPHELKGLSDAEISEHKSFALPRAPRRSISGGIKTRGQLN
jgi:hypoxanthine phosphoribosyltransferase